MASRADQLLRELDEALASATVRNECTRGLHDGTSASPETTNFKMMAGMQESIAIRYNLAVAPESAVPEWRQPLNLPAIMSIRVIVHVLKCVIVHVLKQF